MDDKKQRHREAALRWAQRNREKKRAADRAWAAANKDKLAEKMRRYRKGNPEKAAELSARYEEKLRNDPERLEKRRRSQRCYMLRKRYGIDLETYEQLETEQGGKCLICDREPKRLCVDHCHETGAVRGLLCQPCNKALGYAKDNSATLLSLANTYLPWCDRLHQGLEERITEKRYHPARSPEVRQLLAERFGGSCMACGSESDLCVDHDHKTHKVRGLLCGGCNSALGYAKESRTTLVAMSEYLQARRGGDT
jgi:hypothetical protein